MLPDEPIHNDTSEHFRLPTRLLERFQRINQRRGVTDAQILRDLVLRYCEKYENHDNPQPTEGQGE